MQTATKTCVTCGKDVTNDKRMRDSSGRYWCIDCGKEDQLRKRAGLGGSACSACGETFPDHLLSSWGSKKLCTKCSAARSKGPGLGATVAGVIKSTGNSGGGDKKKTMILLTIMLILAAIAVYMNF